MDQAAREDIAAAAAVRSELGSSYDDVIAEGLIERIGAEIDRRIDARLDGRRRRRGRRPDVGELERRRTLWKGATVGAAATALPAAIAIMAYPYGHKRITIVIVVLVLIAAGYVVTTWAHMRRQLDDRRD